MSSILLKYDVVWDEDYIASVLEEVNADREAEGKRPITVKEVVDYLDARIQDESYYTLKSSWEHFHYVD